MLSPRMFLTATAVFAASLLMQMDTASAWEGGWMRHQRHEYRHHHGGSNFSFRVSILPPDCEIRRFGKHKYYYHRGHYYLRDRYDYVRVPAPVVYHVVQPAPVVYQTVQAAPVVVPESLPADTATVTAGIDAFLRVNIPNERGGYVTVALKKSGNGYLGPQGEYYDRFPEIAQLKAVYVK